MMAAKTGLLANADPRLTSRAWYFSRITVDPSDANVIYMPNVALMFSVDGGKTVSVLRGAPGGDDYHELWVDPKNGAHLVLGTDQGTTVSLNHGKTWSTWYNQPTAQMYHVTTDDEFPYTVYGAQQDSGSRSRVEPDEPRANHAARLVPRKRQRKRLHGRRSQGLQSHLCKRQLRHRFAMGQGPLALAGCFAVAGPDLRYRDSKTKVSRSMDAAARLLLAIRPRSISERNMC
jgi:hypothetical protein